MPPVLAAWSTVTVHRDAHIQHHKALYSVPFALVGKTLWVKATDTVVQLFHQHELVAPIPGCANPVRAQPFAIISRRQHRRGSNTIRNGVWRRPKKSVRPATR